MTAEEALRESQMLRRLQQASEARGMKFYVNPPREVVPEFLGDFCPDAIARGPEGGIIIEMTFPGRSDAKAPLAEVSKLVSVQKGWEFHAIYVNPRKDEAPVIARPTSAQLQASFEEIEALTKGGHHSAAFATAWAALEALARRTSAQAEDRPRRGSSPRAAIQMLAEDGYVEDQTAARLRQMVGVRDAVVHGDLSIDVPRDQVRWLLETLRAIVAEMEAAQVLDKTAFVPGDQRPIYAEHKGHDSPDTVGAGLAVAEG